MLVAFNYAPKGWTQCAGQLLAISQNQALFSLLGTTYGGDGRTTFALPDLRGRAALMSGQGIDLGQRGGEESHTLTPSEVPVHTHALQATTGPADATSPFGNLPATTAGTLTIYKQSPSSYNAPLAGGTVAPAGGSQPHDNRQPYLAMMWIIALQGIFPSKN
jgi:microcystin-dependent protein